MSGGRDGGGEAPRVGCRTRAIYGHRGWIGMPRPSGSRVADLEANLPVLVRMLAAKVHQPIAAGTCLRQPPEDLEHVARVMVPLPRRGDVEPVEGGEMERPAR